MAEKGESNWLKENDRGELACQLNPEHKFKTGASGFLESVPERR